MKIPCLVFLLPLLLCATSPASYVMPDFESVVGQATHIVDAEVIEITKEGHAVIEVREVIKGTETPKIINGVALTCTPDATPERMGVTAKKRYVFFLSDAHLYEERLFFEVTEQPGTGLVCGVGERYRGWMGAATENLPRASFLDLVKANLGRK